MKPLPTVPPPQPDRPDQSGAGAQTSATPFIADPLATLRLRPAVIEAVSSIYDPEIPVNIYDLGLIYEVAADAGSTVSVRMTLTAPGCPAAQSLPGEVERKVAALEGVSGAIVEVVWDPPWTRERMSETARLQLGML